MLFKDFHRTKSLNALLLTIFIAFLGLILTHYATAILVIFYTTTLSIALMFLRSSGDSNRGSARILLSIVIILVLTFLSYEFYVDVYLASKTLKTGIKTLLNLYMRELKIYSEAIEYNPKLTLIDAVKHALSQYVKPIFILTCTIIYLFYKLSMLFNTRNQHEKDELGFIALVAALPTILLGWSGVGSIFVGMFRASPLMQFLLIVNIMRTILLKKENRIGAFLGIVKRCNRLLILLLLVFIIAGFFTNYGIPFPPYIHSIDGEIYVYPTRGQRPISEYALHPIIFTNSSLPSNGDLKFLCIQPYTSFGLCDLLWIKPKIPNHSFVQPRIVSSKEIIAIISKFENVIIPIPLSDELLPGPIGCISLYLKPYNYFLVHGTGMIYSNGLYSLIFK